MGQIYVPFVNWMLMVAVVALVLGFQSSSNLAAAYGVAVTGTMVIDSILIAAVIFLIWKWSRVPAAILVSVFLIADLGTQPAGCVGLAALPGGRTAEVRRLYVRPAHRGNGIARTLMSHAHDHAARHGMTRLILDVLPRPHRRHQLLPPPRLHRNRALRDRVARPDDLHGTGRH